MRRSSCVVLAILTAALSSAPASAASPPTATTAITPLTLEQVMADPDWIGAPVEASWWAWDSQRVQYMLKRDGATIRDTWQQSIDGSTAAVRIDGAGRAELDASNPVYDSTHARMAFVRNGDVFVRDLHGGALSQLTRSNEDESLPQWSRDGGLVWRVENTGIAGMHATACARPPWSRPQRIRTPSPSPTSCASASCACSTPCATTRRGARPNMRRTRRGARPIPPAHRRRYIWATTSPSPTARCRPTAAGCWW